MSLVDVNVMRRHIMAIMEHTRTLANTLAQEGPQSHALDGIRMNYDERPEGHWQLLNELKSQRFFNKCSPEVNFAPWNWHFE